MFMKYSIFNYFSDDKVSKFKVNMKLPGLYSCVLQHACDTQTRYKYMRK